jgi:hypothetical protein
LYETLEEAIMKRVGRQDEEVSIMCRNIRRLYNIEPQATDGEIRAAALQFVRKISGFTNPSAANREAFDEAVGEVATASSKLLGSLVTAAPPGSREALSAKARARSRMKFGP